MIPCWECLAYLFTDAGSTMVSLLDNELSEEQCETVLAAYLSSFHRRGHKRLEMF